MRWLRDFGPRFGWRTTDSITSLQVAANSGAIALICARRGDEGKSGHIAVVVPETTGQRAIWEARKVAAPLLSQSGVASFKYRRVPQQWGSDAQVFAEHAVWVDD